MYLCVITYQYDGPPFEIASKPMPEQRAVWLAAESDRLFPANSHVLAAEVYDETRYAEHAGVAS